MLGYKIESSLRLCACVQTRDVLLVEWFLLEPNAVSQRAGRRHNAHKDFGIKVLRTQRVLLRKMRSSASWHTKQGFGKSGSTKGTKNTQSAQRFF
jgi:hypothetical protein